MDQLLKPVKVRGRPIAVTQPPVVAPTTPTNTVLAVHAHRVLVALEAERAAIARRAVVEAEALADGLPLTAWLRALDLMSADPAAMVELERHTSVLLMAVRAGLQTEEHIIEVTTDISMEDRQRRIRDEGYHAAVTNRPADGDTYSAPADRAGWMEGWQAFRLDVAAFDAGRAVLAERGALLMEGDCGSLPATTSEAA